MGKNKDKSILIRLTEREYNIIQIKAEASDLKVSEYIRQCCVEQKIKGLTEAKVAKKLKEIEELNQTPPAEEQIEGQLSIEELGLPATAEEAPKKRGSKKK